MQSPRAVHAKLTESCMQSVYNSRKLQTSSTDATIIARTPLEIIKKKRFTCLSQPARLIACAITGNVYSPIRSRQSVTYPEVALEKERIVSVVQVNRSAYLAQCFVTDLKDDIPMIFSACDYVQH